jgi:hypothetical protein
LVLDREFSYEELMDVLVVEQIQFNLGDPKRPPRFVDADGAPVKLFIRPEETVIQI